MNQLGPSNIANTGKWYRNQYVLLFCIWVIPTIINLNKAFHIDDTFHLTVAKWLIHHPFQPMTGTINWYNDPEPFSNANQPPLYFYIVALWGRLFGFSEIALHAMQSVFTFGCIFFFFKIARLFSERSAILLTVLFAFNPAFIVNQNLMTDIPLLSILLAFMYTLIKPDSRSDLSRYVSASLLLSAGLLIKYSFLPLVLVLSFAMLYHKKYRYLPVLLIPVLLLSLWSAWNYYEFGAIHMLHRGGGFSFSKSLVRAESLILCLGAVSVFQVLFLKSIFPAFRLVLVVIVLSCLSVPLLSILVYCGLVSEDSSLTLSENAFLVNGVLITGVVGFSFYLYMSGRQTEKNVHRQMPVIYFWLIAVTAFIVGFAPFIATRHALLILPAILILTSSLWEKSDSTVHSIALTGTILSGIIFGVSDGQFADFYRRAAHDIRSQVGAGKVWSAGHWGWQWYCAAQNIQPLGLTTSKFEVGDYVVAPNHTSKQDIYLLNLSRVGVIWYKPDLLGFFSVSRHAGFYATTPHEIPWDLSRLPVDTVVIYKIGSVDGTVK